LGSIDRTSTAEIRALNAQSIQSNIRAIRAKIHEYYAGAKRAPNHRRLQGCRPQDPANQGWSAGWWRWMGGDVMQL
jgi:hypothetical protein